MTDSQARLILLLGLVVMMPIGFFHRLKARTGESLDRRPEGWAILLTLRPLAVLFTVGLAAFMIDPKWMNWSSMRLPVLVRWIGPPFGIAAIVIATWTFRTLGANLTDTVVTRRNATLVTNGPYRWVRHPFYVAFVCGVIAGVLLTDSWFLALAGAGAFIAIYARTRIEESYLVARFGEEYERYMSRTGRFVPYLGRLRD